MPKRILRDGILTSEPVNNLSWAAEVFYRRIHSVVDDFGRFAAHSSLLRAACYPLRLNDVSDQDVDKWLADCADKGLVRVYEVEGKRFLQVTKFDQRLRTATSKCPPPPADGGEALQSAAECGEALPNAARDGDGYRGGDGDGRKRRKPATPCPDSFDVTEAMSVWAVEQGLPAARVMPATAQFLDRHRAKGDTFSDWVSAWRTWMRNEVRFAQERGR